MPKLSAPSVRAIPTATERRSPTRREYAESLPRARVNRFCAVNPEISDAEAEFGAAMDRYKRSTGRWHPEPADIVVVLHELGYRRGSRRIRMATALLDAAELGKLLD